MTPQQFENSPAIQYLITNGMTRPNYVRLLQQSQWHMRAAVKAFAVAGTKLLDAGNRLAPLASYCLRHAAEEHNEDELCKADLLTMGEKPTAQATKATRAMCDTLRAQAATRPYRIIADSLVVEAIAAKYGGAFFDALRSNLLKCEIAQATQYLRLHNNIEGEHASRAGAVLHTGAFTKAERAAIDCACRESRRRFHDFLAQFSEAK